MEDAFDAFRNGNIQKILSMIHQGFDKRTRNGTGMNGLHIARECQPLIVDLLIDIGFELDAKDIVGSTALMLACQYQPSVVPVLINAGCSLDKKNNDGSTALMIACQFQPKVVPALINAGCSLDEKNEDGSTALMFVCSYQPSVVPALIDAGCGLDERRILDGRLFTLQWITIQKLYAFFWKPAVMWILNSTNETHCASQFIAAEITSQFSLNLAVNTAIMLVTIWSHWLLLVFKPLAQQQNRNLSIWIWITP